MQFRVQFAVICLASIIFLMSYSLAQAGSAREKDFQDWRLRCERDNDDVPERCFIVQLAKNAKDNRDVLRIGVRYPDSNKPAMVFLTLPLGIYLPAGLLMQIDQKETFRIDVEICLPNGCHTRMDLTGELLENMRAGRQAKLVFHDSRQQRITVPFSLAGFTAGLAALK